MKWLIGLALIVSSTAYLSPATGWPLVAGCAYLAVGIVLLTGRR